LFNLLLAAGDKEDPAEVAKEMRVARDESGKFCFLLEEYRTTKQMASQ